MVYVHQVQHVSFQYQFQCSIWYSSGQTCAFWVILTNVLMPHQLKQQLRKNCRWSQNKMGIEQNELLPRKKMGIVEVCEKNFKQYVFLYIFVPIPLLVTILNEGLGNTSPFSFSWWIQFSCVLNISSNSFTQIIHISVMLHDSYCILYFKLLAAGPFVQHLVQPNNKESTKPLHYWPLMWNSSVTSGCPSNKGQ